MDETLATLLEIARSQRVVANHYFQDGTRLFAYPSAEGFLIGFGKPDKTATAAELEAVLRRRAQYLSRYGYWLPALFADGSCQLLRRLPRDSRGRTELVEEDIHIARELLS